MPLEKPRAWVEFTTVRWLHPSIEALTIAKVKPMLEGRSLWK
jgi:hypothetical protein